LGLHRHEAGLKPASRPAPPQPGYFNAFH
jgi:hypothetical protein